MRKNAVILSFISLLFLFDSTCQSSEIQLATQSFEAKQVVCPMGVVQISPQMLPVLVPNYPDRDGDICNPFSFEQMRNFTGGTEKGLLINLGDASFQGTIYTGPYPFESDESDYDYARYRRYETLENGAGLLRIDKFFSN